MYSIEEYGTVIHEFDPWFNVRAAQYLADNGVERFFKWYDYMCARRASALLALQ